MNSKLSISDISGIVSRKTGLTKKECEAILKEMFQYASEIISSGESLTINGIGTFGIIWVEPRGSVDINTGEPIVIPGHYKLTFTPDPSLRDAVNEPFACFTTEILPPKSEQAAVPVETAFEEAELQDTESEDATDEEQVEVTGVSVATGADYGKMEKEELVAGDALQEEPAIEIPAAESAEAAVEEETLPESEKEKAENQEAEVENEEYAMSQQAGDEETAPAEIEKIETETAPAEEEEVSSAEAEAEEEAETIPADAEAKTEIEIEAEAETETPSAEAEAEVGVEAEVEAAEAETADAAAFAGGVSAEETAPVAGETPSGDADSRQETDAADGETEQQISRYGEDVATDGQTPKTETHPTPAKKDLEKEYRRRTRNGYIAGFITALLLCLVAGGTAYYIRFHSDNLSMSFSIFKFPFNAGGEKAEMNKPDTAIVLQEAVASEQPADATPETPVDTTSVIETIEPGKFLTTIAKKHYGNKIFWVYIYRENEDRIWNPRYLPKGFKVVVPPPSKYAIDSEDEESIRRAQDLEKQILYEIE